MDNESIFICPESNEENRKEHLLGNRQIIWQNVSITPEGEFSYDDDGNGPEEDLGFSCSCGYKLITPDGNPIVDEDSLLNWLEEEYTQRQQKTN